MESPRQTFAKTLLKKNISLSVFINEMSKVGVYVVSPGETTSSVFYKDEKRYFPKVNESDIVIGGRFG